MRKEVIYAKGHDRIAVEPFDLRFKFPFRLAHGTRTHTSVVLLTLNSSGHESYGEASLPPYLGVTTDEVINFLRNLPWVEILHSDLNTALDITDASAPGMHAAKAAVDMALHDLHARCKNLALSGYLATSASNPVYTTFTLGMTEPEELPKKLDPASPFKMIKIKLGGRDDLAALMAFRKVCDKPFCADVNQGWSDREKAVRIAETLKAEGATFIEQPFPVGKEQDMIWLRERVDVPMILDESVRRLPDLKEIESICDGVNVKLMKSTGIREALKMIDALRTAKLKVVLGAMAESSCGVTAAAHIAGLADWVDLDGPLLIDNDPFRGITYDEGRVILPEGPGAGSERMV